MTPVASKNIEYTKSYYFRSDVKFIEKSGEIREIGEIINNSPSLRK